MKSEQTESIGTMSLYKPPYNSI